MRQNAICGMFVVVSILVSLCSVYAADGDLDSNFGGGIVSTGVSGALDAIRDVAIQSDGKVVGVGYTYMNGKYDMLVLRYNTDGSLDTSFDSDGIVVTTIGAGTDAAYGVTIQSDGKIVAVGSSVDGAGQNNFAVVRYNTDGSLDSSFGSGGKVTTAVSADKSDVAFAAAIQDDGKIVVTGYARFGSNNHFALARYNTDGSLDTTFDSDGMLTTDFTGGTDIPRAIAIQSDGKIIIAGYSDNLSDYDFALVRYNTDGSLDSSFDSDGMLTTAVGSGDDQIWGMDLQPGGKIVVAGQTDVGSFTDVVVARYNTDGSLDTTFDSDGFAITSIDAKYDEARGMEIQSDGKIVVGGRTYNSVADVPSWDVFVMRYNTDGSLDTSFDSDGITTTPVGESEDYPQAMALRDDERIVVAGYWDNGSGADFYDVFIAGFNTDGTLDRTLWPGRVFTPVNTGDDDARSVEIQSDGKVVVAGYGRPAGGGNWETEVVRYNTNGVLDTTFGDDGRVITDVASSHDQGMAVGVQSDDKIVVSARVYDTSSSTWDICVLRYGSDGSLDTSFDSDGYVFTDLAGGHDYVNGIAIQSDDKTVIAAQGDNSGNADFALLRYNTDGSLDTTFDGDGKLFTAVGSGVDAARCVAIQDDGKIVAAGWADIGGNNDFAVVRYNTDGSLDTTFDSDGKVTTAIGSADDEPLGIAIQSSGKIVVAGRTDNGSDDDIAIARYNTDGSLDTAFGGGDGIVTTDLGSGSDEAQAVCVDSDGRIVIVGSSYNGTDWDFVVARYSGGGGLDTTFGNSGVMTASLEPGDQRGFASRIGLEGGIIAVGRTYNADNLDFAVMRFESNPLPIPPGGTLIIVR